MDEPGVSIAIVRLLYLYLMQKHSWAVRASSLLGSMSRFVIPSASCIADS